MRVERSILVVDDNSSFRAMTIRMLEAWGHVVVGEAGRVDEAVALASERRPDTAIVDIGLPDGDGFELTRRLVALPWSLRVIVVSSDSDDAYVDVAEQAGAAAYFPKAELAAESFRDTIERA